MSEKTLKEKTFSGLGWSALDKFFQQLFVFISGIFLARTLGREAYGLIGILYIFVGLANILQDSGFSAALIRKKNITQSDYTTVFYTNVCIGCALYLLLFVLAPLIGRYYEEPELTALARFLFLSFLFNSFAVVQNVKLLKEINYRLIAKINMISIVVSYSVAMVLAYAGYGAWALASQVVIMALVRSTLLWLLGKWRISSGQFSVPVLKELFSFSSKLMLGSILNSLSSNIPQNIIGKQYSLELTGLYNQAGKLFNTASEFLNGTMQSVPFAVLSHVEEEAMLKKAIRKFVRMKALVVFPFFAGIILVAEPFVISILGQEWAGSVLILQLMCIGGIFVILDTSNNDILRVKGKSGRVLSLDIFRSLLIFIVIMGTLVLKASYLYLVGGLSVCFFVKYIVSSYTTNKMIGYKVSELVKDQLPYLATTILAIFIGYALHWFIDNSWILMLCQIVIVASVYISILYVSGSVILKEAFLFIKRAVFK